MGFGEAIAKAGLEIKAIKLRPDNPFTWASGFRMPIYNDNRMFLSHPKYRSLIANGFSSLLQREGIAFDYIAGTSTAGISPATTLADQINAPMIYIRDKPKGHGLQNQIEGIDAESDLEGKRIVVVEDLISTGGSSAGAVQGVRNAKGTCDYCVSIFNYGLDKANQMFSGEIPFNKNGDKLDPLCNVRSLLNYDTLLRVARETNYVTEDQAEMLAGWRADPFGWGEKHGFPKVEK